MQIVGVNGYARSGKDTFASVLVNEFGYTRVAFADKLRECIYALNPIADWTGMRLQDVIDAVGWDGYKETGYCDEIRGLLQRGGTEMGRMVLGDNVWVDSTMQALEPDGKYVFSDMRFENEYDAIVSRGGATIRIDRKGISAVNAHISETSIDNKQFNLYMINNGTLEQFQQSVRDAMGLVT